MSGTSHRPHGGGDGDLGCPGLVMWWQLKSLRLIGMPVLLASVVTAITLFFKLEAFHALTRM